MNLHYNSTYICWGVGIQTHGHTDWVPGSVGPYSGFLGLSSFFGSVFCPIAFSVFKLLPGPSCRLPLRPNWRIVFFATDNFLTSTTITTSSDYYITITSATVYCFYRVAALILLHSTSDIATPIVAPTIANLN